MRKPLCFVVMPFHRVRSDHDDVVIDFDEVFAHLIAPSIENAGLKPHRADEETLGGIFHEAMFERLALCEYAVVDLSLSNPNVFYELGVRHAIRPWATVLMHRKGAPLPLDVAPNTSMLYSPWLLTDPAELRLAQARLTRRLVEAKARRTDSPVHTFLHGLPTYEVDHRRVDAMLEAIERDSQLGQRIAAAGDQGIDAVRAIRHELGEVSELESESVVALLMAFRSVEGWAEMVDLVPQMIPELAEVWVVREQYAAALGRCGRFGEARRILSELVELRPNAETYGLLGGVLKREWRTLVATGSTSTRWSRPLTLAADAYRQGFEIDLRDPYPGVNAVALLMLAGRTDEAADLAPMVRYCIRRRLRSGQVEYWDHVSDLELSIVLGDWASVTLRLPSVLDDQRERFQSGTLLETLEMIKPLMADEVASTNLAAVVDEVRQRRKEFDDGS